MERVDDGLQRAYESSYSPEVEQPGLHAYVAPSPVYREENPPVPSNAYQPSRPWWAQHAPFRRKKTLGIFAVLVLLLVAIIIGSAVGATHNEWQKPNRTDKAAQSTAQNAISSPVSTFTTSPIASTTASLTSSLTSSAMPSATALSNTTILNNTRLASISWPYSADVTEYRVYYQREDNFIQESVKNSTTNQWFQGKTFGAARKGSPIAATITGANDGWNPGVSDLAMNCLCSTH